MVAPLSRRSDMLPTDAAYGPAVLLREIAEQVNIYTFSDRLVQVPVRRGLALRDALDHGQPHSGRCWAMLSAESPSRTIASSSSPMSSRTIASRRRWVMVP